MLAVGRDRDRPAMGTTRDRRGSSGGERKGPPSGLRVVELEIRESAAVVGDDRDALAVGRERRAVEPGHRVKAVRGLHDPVDQDRLGPAVRARGHDVREAEVRRDDLPIDDPPAVDLLDAGKEHGPAVARDAGLMRPAVRSERHVPAAREHVHVASERERDRAAHVRRRGRQRDERDRLRRRGRGAGRRDECRRNPHPDPEVEDDENRGDAGEDELAGAADHEAASTAATTGRSPPRAAHRSRARGNLRRRLEGSRLHAS